MADYRLISVADTFAGESRRIRRLQTYVLAFGAFVVAVLLTLLGYSICKGFDGHLTATEKILVKAAGQMHADTPAAAAPSPVAVVPAVKKTQDAKSAATPESSASSADASLHELLTMSVKAIASTTVAVIWVLVIAITIITISIARAVLSLKPQGLEGGAEERKGDKGASIALPGLEFAKEVVKLVGDTIKGVRG